MIGIRINGEEREVEDGQTLVTLLEWLNLAPDRVAVEHNLKIVPRSKWQETSIRAGDRLEIVQFVGGGCDSGFSILASGLTSPRDEPECREARSCRLNLESKVPNPK